MDDRTHDPRVEDRLYQPDPVAGFAYCRELPPDVPPGMTLAQWRHDQHRRCAGRQRRHGLLRLVGHRRRTASHGGLGVSRPRR